MNEEKRTDLSECKTLEVEKKNNEVKWQVIELKRRTPVKSPSSPRSNRDEKSIQ